jgi:hypothetical protein
LDRSLPKVGFAGLLLLLPGVGLSFRSSFLSNSKLFTFTPRAVASARKQLPQNPVEGKLPLS